MVTSSTYAQYPVVKKIGSDSVVIITVDQAKDINVEFDKLKDSISHLSSKKDSISKNFESYAAGSAKRLQSMYESYISEYNQKNRERAIADSFRVMYMANKKIYENAERRYFLEVRTSAVVSAILMLMVVVASAR